MGSYLVSIRIMTVESADEFYSIMGVLTREMMEFGLMDTNELIKTICTMAPFPFPQLADLREKYTFNIRPLTSSFTLVKRGFQIFHSDDEEDNDHDDQLVMATWCLSNAFSLSKNRGDGGSTTPSPSTSTMTFANVSSGALSSGGEANYLSPSCNNVDPQRMTLDISLLKKQYAKLRERQKQAHIILTGGFQQSPTTVSGKSSVAVNHLLIGKKPLVRKNRRQSVTAPSTPVQPPRDSLMKPSKPIEPTEPNPPNSSRRESGETLSWADVKSERKKRLTTKLSDPSLPSLSEITSRESFSVQPTEQEKDNSDNDSDTSSSSTELCDDVSVDELSDCLSSPEPKRKTVINSGVASDSQPEANKDNSSIVPEISEVNSANQTRSLSPTNNSSSSSDSEPKYDDEVKEELVRSEESPVPSIHSVSPLDSPIRYSWEDDKEYESMKSKILSDLIGDLGAESLESALRMSRSSDINNTAHSSPSLLENNPLFQSSSASYLEGSLDDKLQLTTSEEMPTKNDFSDFKSMLSPDTDNPSDSNKFKIDFLETETASTQATDETKHLAESNSPSREKMHSKIQKSFSDNTAIVRQISDSKTDQKPANGIGLFDGYRSLTEEIHPNRKNSKAQLSVDQPAKLDETESAWKSSSGSLFNPFPTSRQKMRTSSISEVGVRLGLYSPSENKRTSHDKEPLSRSRSTSSSSQHR